MTAMSVFIVQQRESGWETFTTEVRPLLTERTKHSLKSHRNTQHDTEQRFLKLKRAKVIWILNQLKQKKKRHPFQK